MQNENVDLQCGLEFEATIHWTVRGNCLQMSTNEVWVFVFSCHASVIRFWEWVCDYSVQNKTQNKTDTKYWL